MKLVLVSDELAPEIARIFQCSPGYFYAVSGRPATPEAALDTFRELPPGCEFHQKFVFLIQWENQFIGVSDLILGYPNQRTAFLGLLLLDEAWQGQGLGRKAYQLHEEFVLERDFQNIRLAVVESNPVMTFWKKNGFSETGISKPYENQIVKTQITVLEKNIS